MTLGTHLVAPISLHMTEAARAHAPRAQRARPRARALTPGRMQCARGAAHAVRLKKAAGIGSGGGGGGGDGGGMGEGLLVVVPHDYSSSL